MSQTANETLQSLLLSKTLSRCRLSTKLSVSIAFSSVVLAGCALWGTLNLDKTINSKSLYGLFGVYCFVAVCLIAYASVTWNANRNSASPTLRGWHKKAYKMLAGLVVVEHCVYFMSIPIILFHAVGISMSDCLTSPICTGLPYNTWTTVDETSTQRIQRKTSQNLEVRITSGSYDLFVTFLVFLSGSVALLAAYVYSEMVRKKLPAAGKTRPWISLFSNRQLLIRCMMCASLGDLICAAVGLSTLSSWLVGPLLLALTSAYPLFKLKSLLTKDPTITRFQLRRVFQTCLALLFLWLYCAGGGAALSILAPLVSVAQTSSLPFYNDSVVQVAVLSVLHLAFSVCSGVGIYVHLSVTDVLESLLQTKKNDLESPVVACEPDAVAQTKELGTLESGPEPLPEPTMEWGAKHCASCCTKAPDVMLVPCGHSVICGDCSKVLLTIPGFRCPLCCTEILDASRLH